MFYVTIARYLHGQIGPHRGWLWWGLSKKTSWHLGFSPCLTLQDEEEMNDYQAGVWCKVWLINVLWWFSFQRCSNSRTSDVSAFVAFAKPWDIHLLLPGLGRKFRCFTLVTEIRHLSSMSNVSSHHVVLMCLQMSRWPFSIQIGLHWRRSLRPEPLSKLARLGEDSVSWRPVFPPGQRKKQTKSVTIDNW